MRMAPTSKNPRIVSPMSTPDSLARIIHKFSTAAKLHLACCTACATRKRVPPTTIGRNFRNMAETLRNVGGTSGAEQLDP